jgi:hypothetical protein
MLTPMSKINAFPSPNSPGHSRPSIQPSLLRTQSATSLSLSLSVSHLTQFPPEPPTTPPIAAPAPRRPHPLSLPAGAAPHPHPRLSSSPPPHPQDLNLEFLLTLETGLPAGVEDDEPQFVSPLVLPCNRFYRPWEPLLAHDIKDRSWPSLFTGGLQGRRRARAPAHRQILREVSRRQGALGCGRERGI